ncbi:hypothetical protein ACVWXO_005649 [Bradyrhizobium sp. LM2.7]
MARLAQLALPVLFSTYSVSETLKFCELGGKRFETLAKNSSGVVHSSADFHVRSPSEMSGRIAPTLTAGTICNQKYAIIGKRDHLEKRD